MGGPGSGRRKEDRKVFLQRFDTTYAEQGGSVRFIQMCHDPSLGIGTAATSFSITDSYAYEAYEKITGRSFSTAVTNRVRPKKKERQVNLATVAGQSMYYVMEALKGFGVASGISERKSRLYAASGGMGSPNRITLAVHGAKAMQKTGSARSVQRYMYFNVHGPTPEDLWDFYVAVAFSPRAGDPPRFYVIPAADLKDCPSIQVPMMFLQPTPDVTPGVQTYRPPHTGVYKYEVYRNNWGPLLKMCGANVGGKVAQS